MDSRVAILGGSLGAAQAALTLAEMGIEVTVLTPLAALGLGNAGESGSVPSFEESPHAWPLLLRAATHPLVTVHTNTEVRAISGKQGRFTIRATRHPLYVHRDVCTSCGRCEDACSVKVTSLLDGRKITHSAIHSPVPGAKTVPSAYYIQKNGIAPCRAACPLGINVQGFVCLLSKGKVDEALSLINEAAPLAGVLGRVCTHPCEDSCKRGEVDAPVFIRALHRYAADNASCGIDYKRKAPVKSRKEKVAIVGSGPAGLAAAWEMARRGYYPTIFESHAVVGGMLATGIPRFRLPWEVRHREVEAIKALGVDIKTGVTVGRDVSFTDLRERGYRAFFLAIGAHQNRRLNIPGEDLEGVVDAVSLLFALNLRVGASVGSNVAVIGGGNSAVDSARTAKRRSKGTVRVLYRRTAEEMTAVREEVEEAVKEGVSMEFLTTPVEILGDGTRVTGIRCQRMSLGAMEADGRRRPEPIPGSEFVIDADHVVIAIGQQPNTSVLNLLRLEVDSDDTTIAADPLTLETNISSMFAGGDCVTGPNNVVDAVAAGLRAAESIDRYLRGRDLRKGRSLEKPQGVQIDVRERDASRHKRARMPVIPHAKRMGSYEETTLGLPREVLEREAARCLNCALCSECMECERACELNAVFHKDSPEHLEIGAGILVNFASNNGTEYYLRGHAQGTPLQLAKPGIHTVNADADHGLEGELARASAVALEAAIELGLEKEASPRSLHPDIVPEVHLKHNHEQARPVGADGARVGVVLCNCGGSINSVLDFNQVINEVLHLPGVCSVQEISQACSEEGASRIAAQAAEWKLDRVVLAACRCCGLEQICFSCSERRVMCQQHLSRCLNSSVQAAVDFVNIREQCAKVHRDDPTGATRKAIDMISASCHRAQVPSLVPRDERRIEGSVLVLGAGLSSLAAARKMAAQGYSVALVTGARSNSVTSQHDREYVEGKASLADQLEGQGIHVRPWPQGIELVGCPGSYEAVLRYHSEVNRITAGAVIVELEELDGEAPPQGSAISRESLLGRLTAREIQRRAERDAGREVPAGLTTKETSGIFFITTDEADTPEEQVIRGAAAAARASAYLRQGTIRPRDAAVSIDSRLCRGCGDCAAVCSYIEMRGNGGMARAYVDRALCLGCGACIARCPTGAITQPLEGNEQIISTLEALLGRVPSGSGCR